MSKTALLVMDVQKGIVGNLGERADAYVEKVNRAVEAARQANLSVMFIVVRFRNGYPELNPANKFFSFVKERIGENSLENDSPATQPIIEPLDNEQVIAKKRVSAFAGSDLEMILNAQGITDLVLCGISTSGVVLSTLRYASDKDYKLTVLSDACADNDEEVNRILLEKIFPRQADVISIEDWQNSLKQAN